MRFFGYLALVAAVAMAAAMSECPAHCHPQPTMSDNRRRQVLGAAFGMMAVCPVVTLVAFYVCRYAIEKRDERRLRSAGTSSPQPSRPSPSSQEEHLQFDELRKRKPSVAISEEREELELEL